ncbi:MAG: hypothetical protein ABIK28_21680 [Planctomycetota bacterium]
MAVTLSGTPRALFVQGPCRQLFACAALSGDKHGNIRASDLLELNENILHRRAGTEELLEMMGLFHRLFEDLVLLLQIVMLHRAFQGDGEQLHLDRLIDEIVCPGTDRLDCGLHASECRDHHDRHIGPVRLDPVAQIDSIHPRHVKVRQDRIELLVFHSYEGILRRGKRVYSKTAPSQIRLDQVAHVSIIIYNQDLAVHFLFSCGKKTEKRLPFPGSLFTSIQPPFSLTIP